METSKCRGCGADIIWAVTEGRKRIPLDVKEELRFVLGETDNQLEAMLCKTYVTHFATCPKADLFRRRYDA